MADIQTPNKHRPELKEMSDAELERRMIELQHEQYERKQAKEQARIAKGLERAGECRDMFVESLEEAAKIEDEFGISIIPEKIREFCTDAKGAFAPSKKWRKPRP